MEPSARTAPSSPRSGERSGPRAVACVAGEGQVSATIQRGGQSTMSYWPETVVLVTGAAGCIGAHLVTRLRALGAQVHAVSRRPQQARHGETWHVASLSDADATTRLFRSVRPTHLFHLAGEVTGSRGDEVV